MFIVVEGIDGSGKSTLSRALAERLGKDRVVLTREPTDASPWGRRLREAADRGRLSTEEEIEHFHRDRLDHLATLIRPALAAGKIVICDRYVDSTLAYQTRDSKEADLLYARMAPELLEPDVVLILDCPIELALSRIGTGRRQRTRFEQEETLRRASAIYTSRKGERYHHLDATRPFQTVLDAALAAIERKGHGSQERAKD